MPDASFTFTLTQASSQAIALAKQIANADLVFLVDGKEQAYLVKEIPPELLQAEAKRMATIPSLAQRESEMYRCLETCIRMVADSQSLAAELLHLANELQSAGKLFETLELAERIRKMDKPNA